MFGYLVENDMEAKNGMSQARHLQFGAVIMLKEELVMYNSRQLSNAERQTNLLRKYSGSVACEGKLGMLLYKVSEGDEYATIVPLDRKRTVDERQPKFQAERFNIFAKVKTIVRPSSHIRAGSRIPGNQINVPTGNTFINGDAEKNNNATNPFAYGMLIGDLFDKMETTPVILVQQGDVITFRNGSSNLVMWWYFCSVMKKWVVGSILCNINVII